MIIESIKLLKLNHQINQIKFGARLTELEEKTNSIKEQSIIEFEAMKNQHIQRMEAELIELNKQIRQAKREQVEIREHPRNWDRQLELDTWKEVEIKLAKPRQAKIDIEWDRRIREEKDKMFED